MYQELDAAIIESFASVRDTLDAIHTTPPKTRVKNGRVRHERVPYQQGRQVYSDFRDMVAALAEGNPVQFRAFDQFRRGPNGRGNRVFDASSTILEIKGCWELGYLALVTEREYTDIAQPNPDEVSKQIQCESGRGHFSSEEVAAKRETPDEFNAVMLVPVTGERMPCFGLVPTRFGVGVEMKKVRRLEFANIGVAVPKVDPRSSIFPLCDRCVMPLNGQLFPEEDFNRLKDAAQKLRFRAKMAKEAALVKG